jgi:hypothetical protein
VISAGVSDRQFYSVALHETELRLELLHNGTARPISPPTNNVTT